MKYLLDPHGNPIPFSSGLQNLYGKPATKILRTINGRDVPVAAFHDSVKVDDHHASLGVTIASITNLLQQNNAKSDTIAA